MPWQPGESGNPDGSQKRRQFFVTLDRAILQDDGKRLRACVERLLDDAAKGEPWAVQMVADRLDGKPAQDVNATVSGELTVNILKFTDVGKPAA